MKKLFLAGALAIAGMASAQLQQGNWMVGSDLLGLKFTNGVNVRLNPKAAYFIQDRWAVGAGVSLDVAKAANEGDTSTVWTIAPFTRYYFTSTEVNSMLNNGAFFGEGSVGFGGVNNSAGSTTNGVNLGIGAGYAYFITQNVSVEGLLKFDTFVGGGNTNANGDLRLGVGFNIYLPTKKLAAVANDQQ